MITTILFDLDGTLLPMEQDQFLRGYLGGLAKYMTPHGYDPDLLVKAIWKGTGAMVRNNGGMTNETVFWKVFTQIFGDDARRDEPLFEEFYRTDFQKVRYACGFDDRAAKIIAQVKDMGYRVALATNPLFPAIATYSRVHWAGLDRNNFELITTYENSTRCKPDLDYYREIMGKLKVTPQECVMVGNDVGEDMIARELGMQVFLLTDCLINQLGADITQYPHGSFPELITFIRGL